MDKIYLKGLIEEVLYVWGEPIDINLMATISL